MQNALKIARIVSGQPQIWPEGKPSVFTEREWGPYRVEYESMVFERPKEKQKEGRLRGGGDIIGVCFVRGLEGVD